jgi:hypothetical protein
MAVILAFVLGRASVALPVGASPDRGGIPDRKGLIHSCYADKGGALRVIDPSLSTCHAGERRLGWYQRGVAVTAVPQATAGAGGYARVVRTFSEPAGSVCRANANTGGAEQDNACILDSLPLAVQPVSMSCTYHETGTANGQPYTSPWLQGCPGFVAWQDGKLELMTLVGSDGTYKAPANIAIQYSAEYPG